MTTPIKLERAYGMDDATMIQFARTTSANLDNNLGDFTAFDADFDASFVTAYDTLIDNAQSYSSDNQLIDVQVQATLNLEAKMRECRNYFQNMKYFIEKAFPGLTGVWQEFGYNDYDRVRNRDISLIQFMADLFEVATKYTTQLAAAGFDATKVTKIETLTDELSAKKTEQNLSKGSRTSAANNRIILLHSVWEVTQRICFAGKTLYSDNYGLFQLFILPSTNSGGSGPSPTTYSGIIHSRETLEINIPNLVPNSILLLSNTGPEPLSFCGSDSSGVECVGGFIVNPYDSQSVTFESISANPATAVFLNVSHNIAVSGAPDGAYEVAITE